MKTQQETLNKIEHLDKNELMQLVSNYYEVLKTIQDVSDLNRSEEFDGYRTIDTAIQIAKKIGAIL